MDDSGQILWVFKNLPLSSLPQSMAASAGAFGDGEQGKFWAMHDMFFQAQTKWAVDEPDPALLSLAEQLGLDYVQFSACLGGRQALEQVVYDLFDAQRVVSTTPAFIVLSDGQGTLMRGSRPPEECVTALQRILETANTAEPASASP